MKMIDTFSAAVGSDDNAVGQFAAPGTRAASTADEARPHVATGNPMHDVSLHEV